MTSAQSVLRLLETTLLLLGHLGQVEIQDNVFISRAQFYVNFHNQSSWVCGALPMSVMDELPW